MARELTTKQKVFVKEYIVDFNAAAAARRAGYSVKHADNIGNQLMGKTGVSKAIENELKKRNWRTEITAEEIIKDLIEVKSVCMQKVYVRDSDGNIVKDVDGNPVTAFMNTKEGNKALELLGKHKALFSDTKVDVSGGLKITVAYEDSAEEKDDGDDG